MSQFKYPIQIVERFLACCSTFPWLFNKYVSTTFSFDRPKCCLPFCLSFSLWFFEAIGFPRMVGEEGKFMSTLSFGILGSKLKTDTWILFFTKTSNNNTFHWVLIMGNSLCCDDHHEPAELMLYLLDIWGNWGSETWSNWPWILSLWFFL